MTTEDKIKEAFEAQYGTRNEWRDMRIYDSAWEDFRSGYMACLNGLEQQLKDAERYRFIKDEPWSAHVSDFICHHKTPHVTT